MEIMKKFLSISNTTHTVLLSLFNWRNWIRDLCRQCEMAGASEARFITGIGTVACGVAAAGADADPDFW
jgi:hypothetical protein